MDALRHSKLTARLVLAWFALFVVVSIASTLIKPANFQMVCSSSGAMKLVLPDGEGASGNVVSDMECPLCTGVHAPLPTPVLPVFLPSALSYAMQSIVAAHIAWLTAPPLPSRGPPVLI